MDRNGHHDQSPQYTPSSETSFGQPRVLPQPYAVASWSNASTRTFPSYASSLPSPAPPSLPSATTSSTSPFVPTTSYQQQPSPFADPLASNMSGLASNAPLPSPSGTKQMQPSASYFNAGSAATQPSQMQMSSGQQGGFGQMPMMQRPMQKTPNGHSGPLAADTFLQSSSLLAEAAKRAQMAVMERDFGEMGF